MRCLVIEDDSQLRGYIEKGLRESGHNVDTADNGRDGLFLATTETYDVLIVDWMLPEVDGMRVIHALRAGGDAVPILVLSARSQVEDRVHGLRAGADDYLVKPFAFDELLARVEVLSQRKNANTARSTTMKCHDLELNLMSRKAVRDGTAIDLNTREFTLLEYLMRHMNQVVTRTMLLENVWDLSL
jgi:two-component system OmpR family response regulator